MDHCDFRARRNTPIDKLKIMVVNFQSIKVKVAVLAVYVDAHAFCCAHYLFVEGGCLDRG